MNHRDAEISEVVVVVHEHCCERLPELAELLGKLGMEIVSTIEDEGVINGTIEAYKVAHVEKIECVNCVRTVLTYIADYPTGDPRDLDGEDDEDAEAV